MVKMNRSIFKKSKLKTESILKKSKSVRVNKKTKRMLGMCRRRAVKRMRVAAEKKLSRKGREKTLRGRYAVKEGHEEKRRLEDVNINIKVTVEPEKRRGLKRKSLEVSECTGVTKESAGVTKERRESVGVTKERSDSAGVTKERRESVGVTKERSDSAGVTKERSDSAGVTKERSDSAGVTREGKGVSTERKNLLGNESVVNKLKESKDSVVEAQEVGGRPSIIKKEVTGSVEDGKSATKTFKIIKKNTSEGEKDLGHLIEKESEKSVEGSEERKKNESSFENQEEKPSEIIEKLINKTETYDRDNSAKETKVPKSTSTTHAKVNKKVKEITESSTIHPLKRISSLNVKDNASTKEDLLKKLDINEKQSPSTFKVVKEHPYESKTTVVENSESSKDKGKDKNKKLCKKEPSCKRDNKSIFAEDCDICSRINNGKNKSNRSQGLKEENLFGTPKTKYRKE